MRRWGYTYGTTLQRRADVARVSILDEVVAGAKIPSRYDFSRLRGDRRPRIWNSHLFHETIRKASRISAKSKIEFLKDMSKKFGPIRGPVSQRKEADFGVLRKNKDIKVYILGTLAQFGVTEVLHVSPITVLLAPHFMSLHLHRFLHDFDFLVGEVVELIDELVDLAVCGIYLPLDFGLFIGDLSHSQFLM